MCSRHNLGYLEVLQNTTLTPLQQTILRQRYIDLVRQYALRCLFLSILFHSTRTVVTVGSLIVPALLSIQYTEASPSSQGENSMSYQIYWVTWVISLLVTTCNGIQSIFKIEKKYYFLHTVMEQLRSEGWQYLELSGRYSGYYTPGDTATHENQFVFFCAQVEKIKMKQVEEEYWKVNETQQQQQQQQQTSTATGTLGATGAPAQQQRRTIDQLIPPTSMRPHTNVVVDNETTESHTLVTIREEIDEEEKPAARVENPVKDGVPSPNSQTSKKETSRYMPVSILLSETTDTRGGNVLLSPEDGLSKEKPSLRE